MRTRKTCPHDDPRHRHGRIDPLPSRHRNCETGTAFGHLAWFVESVDRKSKELSAKGVGFPLEPKTMKDGTRIAFAADPTGYRIEFIENPPRASTGG